MKRLITDLHLNVTLGNTVLDEAAILWLNGVATMREAGDPVTLLPLLGDLGPDFFNDAGVVAPDRGSRPCHKIDMLPEIESII